MFSLDAIAQLYRSHRQALARRFRGRSSFPDAEDDVQTAFLNILHHPPTEVRSAGGLATTAALNAQRDRVRRSSSRISQASVAISEVVPAELSADPEQEYCLLLKQIVLAMPIAYRDAFILSRFQGLTYEQVAEVLGISAKAVEYRISKALAHCQASLLD